MSEDQQDDGAGGNSYESTLEVDKDKLMAEISTDRGERESKTARMPAVEQETRIETNPLLEEENYMDEGRTIPMPAVTEDPDHNQETTNFSVPDELLRQISQPEVESRWETIEIVIEEVEDSEGEFETQEDEPGFILEKIGDPSEPSFDGELSSKRTSPVLYRMEFEAEVNEDGTFSVPEKYINSGHVRPGMRFKIEAIGMREDE